MTTYVFLGHGAFDQAGGSYPGEILVPTGTSLRFFSDAGQRLVLPAAGSDFDYAQVANVWEHFREEDQPLTAGRVTYNFVLGSLDTEAERTAGLSLGWGATPVALELGGADWCLCQGDEETCPTPALLVQQRRYDETGEGAPVPAGRWLHDCDGILGTYGGHDLVWMSCTGFMHAEHDLPPEMTADYSGPGASDVSNWVPDDAAWDEINRVNRQNIKDTDDGGEVALVAGGTLVLIGSGHSRRAAEYVARQGDVENGILTVEKGGFLSHGSLEVSGIGSKRSEVEYTIAQFSDKTVRFV